MVAIDEHRPLSPSEDENECRICKCETDERLWKPCQCKYAGVHQSCLIQWIETRPGPADGLLKCEVCAADYAVELKKELVFESVLYEHIS